MLKLVQKEIVFVDLLFPACPAVNFRATDCVDLIDWNFKGIMRPRWPNGRVSALGWKAPCSKPYFTKDPSFIGPVGRQNKNGGQNVLRCCGAAVWRWGAISGVVLVI
ncbi:hypothetical protein AVEN_140047-1 [Araneus ventricosus]|uniref:Uncharacterized protein n=1 Tax=Araneus ventricosus TaxID=182803 RepID=A0A4Y2LHM7_ARAVE|nr:hypothetical protein AVEN_140047-1 [Araneus ventricosus]